MRKQKNIKNMKTYLNFRSLIVPLPGGSRESQSQEMPAKVKSRQKARNTITSGIVIAKLVKVVLVGEVGR